jgi:hypothetical protein
MLSPASSASFFRSSPTRQTAPAMDDAELGGGGITFGRGPALATPATVDWLPCCRLGFVVEVSPLPFTLVTCGMRELARAVGAAPGHPTHVGVRPARLSGVAQLHCLRWGQITHPPRSFACHRIGRSQQYGIGRVDISRRDGVLFVPHQRGDGRFRIVQVVGE